MNRALFSLASLFAGNGTRAFPFGERSEVEALPTNSVIRFDAKMFYFSVMVRKVANSDPSKHNLRRGSMDMLLAASGILGAACCVGMFAAVTFGKVQAEQPSFCIVNGIGSILILIGSAHDFDPGDAGTVAQELIWAVISFLGALRALRRAEPAHSKKNDASSAAAHGLGCLLWPLAVLVADFDRTSSRTPEASFVVSAIVFWAGLLTVSVLLTADATRGPGHAMMQISLGLIYLIGIWASLSRALAHGAQFRTTAPVNLQQSST